MRKKRPSQKTLKMRMMMRKIAEVLIQKQRCEYEKKLIALKTLKTTKGKSAAVFNLKAKILGGKKDKQEAVVIEDPNTKELLFEPDKIKETSLNYLKDLLKNREPKDDYKNDIEIINIMHQVRMEEKIDEDEKFTEKDFGDLLKHLQKNNKSKYKFILKSGFSYQKCLYKLFKMVWENKKEAKTVGQYSGPPTLQRCRCKVKPQPLSFHTH
jgi:hypothetical protein